MPVGNTGKRRPLQDLLCTVHIGIRIFYTYAFVGPNLRHSRDVVERVDDDETKRNEQNNPRWDDVGRDQERHPGEKTQTNG